MVAHAKFFAINFLFLNPFLCRPEGQSRLLGVNLEIGRWLGGDRRRYFLGDTLQRKRFFEQYQIRCGFPTFLKNGEREGAARPVSGRKCFEALTDAATTPFSLKTTTMLTSGD